jgi:putative sigma-54 modulation protein
MRVRMVSQKFSITSALHDYLERRLQFAFSPVHNQISEVTVKFRDLNGQRGGQDMMCQIVVNIPGSSEIIIKEVQGNLYTAIDSAVRRIAYRVMEILARRKGEKGKFRRTIRRNRSMPAEESSRDRIHEDDLLSRHGAILNLNA